MRDTVRHSFTILFVFLLIGLLVGLTGSLVIGIWRNYLQTNMMEIFFWTLARNVNHHMSIFLIIALVTISFYSVLRLFRISSMRSIKYGVLPLSLLGVFYFYILPIWHTLANNWPRLIKLTGVPNVIVGLIVLVILLTVWFTILRKRAGLLWKDWLVRNFRRPVFILSICLFPVFINLLDLKMWSPSPVPGWNLILISLDTLRADHLGCYGYDKDISPNIDDFAFRGIRFDKAISQSSWTLPAHASLFTGLYPSAHGATHRKKNIPNSMRMFCEILRNGGYSAVAFTGGGFLDPIYGFDRGFSEYAPYEALDSEEVWNFIDASRSRPFFLFLHTYQIHDYFVPDEMVGMLDAEYQEEYGDFESIRPFLIKHIKEDLDSESRKVLAYLEERYDASILFTDDQFGSLLKGLEDSGLLEKTLIVLISDHGEEFGDHGRTHHGHTLYNEQIHIPLLMSVPDNRLEHVVVEEIVELIDVFPTILDLLGFPVPDDIDARSLTPILRGGDHSGDGLAFSEISAFDVRNYSVCDSSTKLIYYPETAGLDFPGSGRLETLSITWGFGWEEVVRPSGGDQLYGPLQQWYERMMTREAAVSKRGEISLNRNLQEKLEALGYIQ